MSTLAATPDSVAPIDAVAAAFEAAAGLLQERRDYSGSARPPSPRTRTCRSAS